MSISITQSDGKQSTYLFCTISVCTLSKGKKVKANLGQDAGEWNCVHINVYTRFICMHMCNFEYIHFIYTVHIYMYSHIYKYLWEFHYMTLSKKRGNYSESTFQGEKFVEKGLSFPWWVTFLWASPTRHWESLQNTSSWGIPSGCHSKHRIQMNLNILQCFADRYLSIKFLEDRPPSSTLHPILGS